jgi:hypothetical protein
MASPGGAVNALGIAMLRAYCANLQTIELVPNYYEVIVPGAVSRADVTPTNNFYVQWEAALDEDGSCAAHAAHFTGIGSTESRTRFVKWVCMELRLPGRGPIQKKLFRSVGLGEDGQAQEIVTAGEPAVPRTLQAVPAGVMPRVAFRANEDFLRQPTAVEVPQAHEWARAVFPQQKGKEKKSRGEAAMTRLTGRSRELVMRVRRLSPHVADSLTVWLRGFSAERLQEAAATLAMAKFDELFIQEGLDDAESLVDDDEETSEWAG